ncbi:hypothetical protein P3H15_55185, partial [Rhodococcus sp. T2V]|nr:hypothetical protein [Rhodococcus sp. T2V]
LDTSVGAVDEKKVIAARLGVSGETVRLVAKRFAGKVSVDTGDVATKRFIGSCYKGYIGRMVNPDMWTPPTTRAARASSPCSSLGGCPYGSRQAAEGSGAR